MQRERRSTKTRHLRITVHGPDRVTKGPVRRIVLVKWQTRLPASVQCQLQCRTGGTGQDIHPVFVFPSFLVLQRSAQVEHGLSCSARTCAHATQYPIHEHQPQYLMCCCGTKTESLNSTRPSFSTLRQVYGKLVLRDLILGIRACSSTC